MIGRLIRWARRHPVLALALLAVVALAGAWVALWQPRVGGVGAFALLAAAASSMRRTKGLPPVSQPERDAAERHEDAVAIAQKADRAEDAAVAHRAHAAATQARETTAAEPVSAPRPRSKYLEKRP